jgi:hypothetical protein
VDELEAQITSELLQAPRDEFTSARSARVHELRKQGRHDLSKRIAALRRPSVALWALNQAGEVARAELDAVRTAGERLREAQVKLLQGDRGAARAMQDATQEQRHAIDVLSRRLRMALTAQGHAASEDTLSRVRVALRNASVADDDTWSALRWGRLLVEPEAASFPAMDGASLRRVAVEREDHDAEAHQRRMRDAEADVRRAEQLEQNAREQAEAARDRHEQAINTLAEARAALDRLRQER